MNINRLFNEDNFLDNPTPRVPIILCLDVSGSMGGRPVEEMNEGIRLFYEALREDETARYAADVAVVAFNSAAECVSDFHGIDSGTVPEVGVPEGGTDMGAGIRLSLDLLEARKAEYDNAGIDSYKPWMVLMTDGQPNGDEEELKRSIERARALTQRKALTIFPIGIGGGADMDMLRRLSDPRPPLRLKGLKFREFFAWLSQSASSVSQSMPGEDVQLDVEGIKSWGTL